MVSVLGCGWKLIFSCQSIPNCEILRQGFVQVLGKSGIASTHPDGCDVLFAAPDGGEDCGFTFKVSDIFILADRLGGG